MRVLLYIVALFFLTSEIWSSDWKIGSSLKGATSQLTSADLFSTENLGFWPEENITLYSLPDGSRLMVSKNYFPFGVLTKIDGHNTFLIDYNGDAILDYSPQYLFVPPWVADRTSEGTDRGDQIVDLYEKKFDSFNGEIPPSDSETMKGVARRLVEVAKDIKAPDRIYVYFDYLYDICYSQEEFGIAETNLLNIEKITSKTVKSRACWLIEAVERAYKVKDLEKVKRYDEELVRISPDFVPGLYYQYLLESDPKTKEQEKTALVNDHKNHWMVKNRFADGAAN